MTKKQLLNEISLFRNNIEELCELKSNSKNWITICDKITIINRQQCNIDIAINSLYDSINTLRNKGE